MWPFWTQTVESHDEAQMAYVRERGPDGGTSQQIQGFSNPHKK